MNMVKLTKEMRLKKYTIDGEEGEFTVSNFAKIQADTVKDMHDSITINLNKRFNEMLAECDDDNSSNKVNKYDAVIYLTLIYFFYKIRLRSATIEW